MEKCFVAVSGGVDSAVALLLLKNKGYSVEGITMRVFGKELVPDATDNEIEDAKNLCNSLGVTHHLTDLSQEFRVHVIGDFISAYANGETPNPCIVCNKYIKFGALSDYAFSHGAQKYATGHYVRTKICGDRRVIVRAKDNGKDQSYMLWGLTQEQIMNFEAPLGEYTKDEVRDIARENGFAVANKGDSQDICFIPDGDYRTFLDRVAGKTDKFGDFVLKNGTKLGRHQGQRCYTLGQRKGLGIAYTEPLYVIGRNIEKNQIILGKNEDLFTDKFIVRNASFSALDFPNESINCEVRVRYRAPFVKSRLTPLGEGRILVETEEMVRAVTAGQSAVFYDGDTLLGGGIIENEF
ncbi:MAG: tRNA 2-thiouridine(34) synthase MnmA [Clostridia bacterium]|nr:tRNA 2-thiouridine(34) synthase MnmA [Clostridia bacterium]